MVHCQEPAVGAHRQRLVEDRQVAAAGEGPVDEGLGGHKAGTPVIEPHHDLACKAPDMEKKNFRPSQHKVGSLCK